MNGFHGPPTRHISSKFIQLEVLEHAGPRIVQLHFRGSASLFSEVPDFVIPTDFGDCRMWVVTSCGRLPNQCHARVFLTTR